MRPQLTEEYFMSKQHDKDYKQKFPFLANLVVADNDFQYVDEQGRSKKVDPKEIIQKLKERKKEIDKNHCDALH
jgi:chromosome condensin MukBEF ATPase and DNA-binding subunit MukB